MSSSLVIKYNIVEAFPLPVSKGTFSETMSDPEEVLELMMDMLHQPSSIFIDD